MSSQPVAVEVHDVVAPDEMRTFIEPGTVENFPMVAIAPRRLCAVLQAAREYIEAIR